VQHVFRASAQRILDLLMKTHAKTVHDREAGAVGAIAPVSTASMCDDRKAWAIARLHHTAEGMIAMWRH
jgi:hypothetical protein